MFPPIRLRHALSLGGLSVKALAVRTWRTLNDNELMTRASAIAFYAMLAVVPFLGLILLVVIQLLPDVTKPLGGSGLGDKTLSQLRTILQGLVPENAYALVEDQIVRIQREPPFALISIGLVIALWSSSSLFLAVIDAMNRIAGVAESRSFVRLRLVGMLMTVLQASILVGSLLVILAWPVVLRWFGVGETAGVVVTALRWVVLLVMVLVSFALTYFIGPDARQRWEWISPGSLIGAFAFLVASEGFRYYIQKFTNYTKTYGSLGGVMVLLFWFWISALVLLVGAQINRVIEDASPLGRRTGQKADPTVALDLSDVAPVPHDPDRLPGPTNPAVP